MKKLQKFLLLVSIILVSSIMLFASGQAERKSLVLAHGKVEIDAPFKEYAALWGEKNGVDVTIKTVGGGGADLATELKASYAAGDLPDIFSLSGQQEFLEWEGILTDLSNEDWVEKTSVPFKLNGKVYGFPVAIEGWGLAYNKDILDKAGIDPSTLNSLGAYKAAFKKIDSMKDQLGLSSVVSMAASAEMFWVTAHHNINSYLSNGLSYGDLSVTNLMLDGKLDEKRFSEYADWVELLFLYSDQAVLTTGNYDAQVGAFVNQKAAFLHQGNWVDPNLKDGGATFETGFAPHGSLLEKTDGIFVAPPSFYIVNKESDSVDIAKKFLNDLVLTPEGQDFMVNKAGMIPAFNNVKLKPQGQLSQSVQEWSNAGKVYSWNQYYLSNDFRNTKLAPIYNQFALKKINKNQFINLFKEAVKNIE